MRGAMITAAPFAFSAAGLYMVRVGMTTLRTIRLPVCPLSCSRRVDDSEPGATPGRNRECARGIGRERLGRLRVKAHSRSKE